MKDIRESLKAISSENALDVATGDGIFIRLLMKTIKDFESFTGIDISPKNLERASRLNKRAVAKFNKMDGRDLDFPDDLFDLVSISESLHHIENPHLVLKEIYRVLQPNGYFVLQESISDENQEKSRVSDVLLHDFISGNDVLRGLFHRGFFKQQDIIQMVRESGFIDINAFFSRISLKCDLCKYLEDCTDSMSKKNINKGLREVTRSLKHVKAYSQYFDIKKEASKLRKIIRQNGYSPASVVFIIAQK
ncbi:MAG: class I SAM-dependent methyltransferase [Candidatus Thorarchaeota archaeon]